MYETESKTRQKRFVHYEYKEVMANRDSAPRLLDEYQCFGWELNKEYEEAVEIAQKRDKANHEKAYKENTQKPWQKSHNSPSSEEKITLYLRRNRSLLNLVELTRLQRNFEACETDIAQLNRHKTSIPLSYALFIGLLGTAFMACSVFAVTADPPYILLCILFAIPGFAGWAAAYPVYQRMLHRQEKKIAPLIEKKQQEIAEICEKGMKLQY